MVRKVGTTASASIAGSASSTRWPRSAQSDAVSCSTRSESAATGAPLGRLAGDGDAERARIGAHLREEGACWRRRDVGIARAGARRRIEQRRAVPHRERHRVLDGEATERFAEVGRHGVARPRRAQADQAAGRRRRADRAEAVRGMGDRQHARGHGRRSAAARAGRCPLQVPGIARGAVELGARR